MPGLVQPTEPGVLFDLGPIRATELDNFLKKARAASVPGPNGITYRVYKKCPIIRKWLLGVLKNVWSKGAGVKKWSEADGIFIPKVLRY